MPHNTAQLHRPRYSHWQSCRILEAGMPVAKVTPHPNTWTQGSWRWKNLSSRSMWLIPRLEPWLRSLLFDICLTIRLLILLFSWLIRFSSLGASCHHLPFLDCYYYHEWVWFWKDKDNKLFIIEDGYVLKKLEQIENEVSLIYNCFWKF